MTHLTLTRLDIISLIPLGPDSVVNPSLDVDDFKEYEYTANNLDEFIAFSIKIVMQGSNSSEPPRIKDLRAIALAT